MDNKIYLVCSLLARFLLFICFLVALVALLWGGENIYMRDLVGFVFISLSSISVCIITLRHVKKIGLGIYLAICLVGVLSVGIMAIIHSNIYGLPLTHYSEDFVAVVCFIYMGCYAKRSLRDT